MSTYVEPRFTLENAAGRRRAYWHLYWTDHGFLRAVYPNLVWLPGGMARSNQPSPGRIRAYAAAGLRTIINLRGPDDSGAYLLEREACLRHGVELIDFRVKSRDAPSRETVLGARDLFARIAYPALMHCKSGADRVGLMSALYMHFRCNAPIPEAKRQLALRYGHVRQGKTGMLDFFLESYLASPEAAKGQSFEDWVAHAYDPAAVKAQFLSQWWANVLVDRVLRRE